MKKGRYTESQIFHILREAESGIPVPALCRQYGMSDASLARQVRRHGRVKYDPSVMTQ